MTMIRLTNKTLHTSGVAWISGDFRKISCGLARAKEDKYCPELLASVSRFARKKFSQSRGIVIFSSERNFSERGAPHPPIRHCYIQKLVQWKLANSLVLLRRRLLQGCCRSQDKAHSLHLADLGFQILWSSHFLANYDQKWSKALANTQTRMVSGAFHLSSQVHFMGGLRCISWVVPVAGAIHWSSHGFGFSQRFRWLKPKSWDDQWIAPEAETTHEMHLRPPMKCTRETTDEMHPTARTHEQELHKAHRTNESKSVITVIAYHSDRPWKPAVFGRAQSFSEHRVPRQELLAEHCADRELRHSATSQWHW